MFSLGFAFPGLVSIGGSAAIPGPRADFRPDCGPYFLSTSVPWQSGKGQEGNPNPDVSSPPERWLRITCSRWWIKLESKPFAGAEPIRLIPCDRIVSVHMYRLII
jgi:hypothetical protein